MDTLNADARISGMVTKSETKDNNVNIFTIFAPGCRMSFTLTYTGFCLIRYGDIVSALCKKINDNYFQVVKRPLVKLPTDSASVYNFLMSCSKSCGITTREANAVQREISNIYQSKIYAQASSPCDVISAISDCWYKTRSLKVIQPISDIITLERAENFISIWRKRDIRRLHVFGFTNTEMEECRMGLLEIYNHICINPYRLAPVSMEKCREIDDLLSRCALQIEIECGTIVRDIYSRIRNASWSCVLLNSLQKRHPKVRELLVELIQHYDVVKDTIMSDGKKEEALYLRRTYLAESTMASFVAARMKPSGDSNVVNGIRIQTGPVITMSNIEIEDKTLDAGQISAVHMVAKGGISIITGGPGKGKTTVIKEIVRQMIKAGVPYAICSFTGKAVARVKEVVPGSSPATMHRMIAAPKHFGAFKYLIIDECSMVTTELFYDFIVRFGTDYAVVLIGDVGQIPPIGPGTLFREILKSHTVNKTILKITHRVLDVPGSTDGIILNLDRIVKWKFGEIYQFMPTDNFMLKAGKPTLIIELIKMFKNLDVRLGDIVVLSPYTDNLDIINKGIQMLYNGANARTEDTRGAIWHINDRVIMTSNNYEVKLQRPIPPQEQVGMGQLEMCKKDSKGNITHAPVMNGETGVVISLGNRFIVVDFGDKRLIEVPFESGQQGRKRKRPSFNLEEETESDDMTTENLKLAYALTIHRAQGSEWPIVFFWAQHRANSMESGFWNRCLTYTAISRPRRALFIVGDTMAAAQSIAKPLPFRCEYLNVRLKNMLDEIPEEEEVISADPYTHAPDELPPTTDGDVGDIEWD